MNPSKKRERKLTEWQLRAEACIAHGALTNSKRISHYPEGCPTHFSRAEGALAWDVTGKQFVDYVQALGGSGIFGYRPAKVIEAVKDQLDLGTIFSMGSDLEIEVAEELQRFFPDHTHWRFFKTGTEACMAAVRISRACSGHTSVINEGYHGWSEMFVSLTPPAYGVEKCDIAQLSDQPLESAMTVILEPVALDASNQRIQWLHELEKKCDFERTVIYDEVVTCFRFPKGSVTRCYGLSPDIVVLGKAMASGFPLAAVGMSKRHTETDWFCSSTFAGDCVALRACKETLRLFRNLDMDWLWKRGQRFLDQFNALDPEIQIKGYPTRGAMDLESEKVAAFVQLMAQAGVLMGRAWLYTFDHPPCDDEVLSLAQDAVRKIQGGYKLQGKPPKLSFKR